MGLFAVVGIFVAVSLMRPVAAQEVKGTLITVYDRGAETTFITQARTLREAFVNQDISVNSKDAVEPSLEIRHIVLGESTVRGATSEGCEDIARAQVGDDSN